MQQHTNDEATTIAHTLFVNATLLLMVPAVVVVAIVANVYVVVIVVVAGIAL